MQLLHMPKIDLRSAVNSVRDYVTDFKDMLGNNLDNFLIEETELSEDENFWLITIGFDHEVDPQKRKTYTKNPLVSEEITNLLPQKQTLTVERVYKTFKVDSSTGEVISMKMYKL